MKLAVGSKNPVKKQAVYNTFSKVFGEVEVVMRASIHACHRNRMVTQS
ncbi:MAG: hypothetical protein ACXV5N_13710 [Halobacteriota archaeon]